MGQCYSVSIVECNVCSIPNGDVLIGFGWHFQGNKWMPITYVMHWMDTSKPLELTTLYKFVKTMFEHEKCCWPSNLSFSKFLLSRLCCSLSKLAIGRLGKINTAKQIVKKEKTFVFFILQHHEPLVIFCHYETNLMFLNPTKTRFGTNF